MHPRRSWYCPQQSAQFENAPLGLDNGFPQHFSSSKIIFQKDLGAKTRSPEVNGYYTPERALEILLRGTGLSYSVTSKNVIAITRITPKTPAELNKETDIA